MGYHKDSITTATGDFSVRGMVIDIFPINEVHPLRIELDEIEKRIQIYRHELGL